MAKRRRDRRRTFLGPSRIFSLVLVGVLATILAFAGAVSLAAANGSAVPTPLLSQRQPVDWWFVFKFNVASFPGCGENAARECPFGGEAQSYALSQQFVYASSAHPTLRKGEGCAGATMTDPLGATFGEVYDNAFYYVVWNDQFYGDPAITGCGDSCGGPWGHSKGMLAWNEAGEGVVLQVTTPSWPAAASKHVPRKTDGNTLGCIANDNDVKVSQHFFALKLTKDDVVKVLKALKNASVVTDPHNHQIANIGGPPDIQLLIAALGAKSTSKTATKEILSNGVILISKPSRLNVPAWQMVSSILGGVSLRAATWWTSPAIPSTTAQTSVACWDPSLRPPGAVEIATAGHWDGKEIGLKGGPGNNSNHAKIGVSTSGSKHYVILGDMNQQGVLRAEGKRKCDSSQNGRGGLFYVLDNKALFDGISDLIRGGTAPTTARE
jgi:hypothetical protein